MIRAAACLVAVCSVLSPSAQSRPPAAGPVEHDKAFWRAIVANGFAPPEGADLAPLVRELGGALASPDPELRDEIAYSTLVNWVYRRRIVPVPLRRELIAAWTANLRAGIGEQTGDGVFRRSFSALGLALMAGTDNEDPFLTRAEFRDLLTAAIAYLRDERDVRGFDPVKGWMHSVAHTADLLKFLGRSRHLDGAGQGEILDAIAAKLERVPEVLTHGEDERLARAVLSLAARDDLDAARFDRWARALAAARPAEPLSPESLARAQNRRHLLVWLYAVVSTDPRESPSLTQARTVLSDVLKAG